ncbi:hypothetical protein AVEN_75414-1 [Araneus ventricosus]|uniref:Integrase catalytic domain-containing protein n=1 Tax=Araneus ventricosus TaxID=182803 RepID=A0A4Y2JA74_ARAVE|nr:hypothetical protein AVEN_75414-1 [Araneus ventricosus]
MRKVEKEMAEKESDSSEIIVEENELNKAENAIPLEPDTESNPVERFHRTVKRLLKALCLEAGEEWEKNLPSALLALLTVTHETTGFSPSEIVLGENLRIPETLLYEKWFELEDDDSSVTEYVFRLINRLKRSQEVAVKQMEELQIKQKSVMIKNAVKRAFKEGVGFGTGHG